MLAQNSFLFRLLGSDVDDSNFTKEYFKEARFYLDTNVLLNAIEPNTRHHDSYNLIKREVKKFNADIYVFNQNIRELENLLNHKYEDITETLKSCPTGVINEIDDFLSDRLQKQIDKDGEIDLEAIFERYRNIEDWAKSNQINVNSIESLYTLDDQKVEIHKARVQYAYKKRKGTPKSNNQSIIDAKLLLAASQVKAMHDKTWVLTMDTTLPEVELEGNDEPLVLTIEALLQWLSIGFVENGNDYAKIFSTVLTERLLPSKQFFSFEDFKIFHDLEKNVKELPERDVIECMEHIRKNIGNYNLSESDDREKLHYEIDKFFKRSDLEYKDNLIKLNKKLGKEEEKNNKLQNNFEEYREESKKKFKNLEEQRDNAEENAYEIREELTVFKKNVKNAIKAVAIFLIAELILNTLTLLALNLMENGYFQEISILQIESIIFAISLTITILWDINNYKLLLKLKSIYK